MSVSKRLLFKLASEFLDRTTAQASIKFAEHKLERDDRDTGRVESKFRTLSLNRNFKLSQPHEKAGAHQPDTSR